MANKDEVLEKSKLFVFMRKPFIKLIKSHLNHFQQFPTLLY